MFTVAAERPSSGADKKDKDYQMSARMTLQYNQFKMKLNEGKKMWPSLKKVQVNFCL